MAESVLKLQKTNLIFITFTNKNQNLPYVTQLWKLIVKPFFHLETKFLHYCIRQDFNYGKMIAILFKLTFHSRPIILQESGK